MDVEMGVDVLFYTPALFFFNKRPFEITIILFAFSIYIMPNITKDAYLWSFFFAGMLCREIKEKIELTKINAEFLLISSIILIIAVNLTLFRVPGTIFLAFIFFSIISGGSLWGYLKLKQQSGLELLAIVFILLKG